MESIVVLITISVLVFILGSCVGSFLNVVIYRLPKGEEIIKKWRSYCPQCKTNLKPAELIPIFSYFVLSAKCRTCGGKISFQYPAIETLTATLFLASFLLWSKNSNLPLTVESIFTLLHQFFIISVLAAIFVIDAKHGIIPDSIIKIAILGSMVFLILIFSTQIMTGFVAGLSVELAKSFGVAMALRAITALGTFLFFGLLILATAGRGMGVGDAKFGFWLGFVFLYPEIFLVIFLSFVIGAVFAILLILFGKKKFGETIPFGPHLATAALITLFFGSKLLDWYLSLL